MEYLKTYFMEHPSVYSVEHPVENPVKIQLSCVPDGRAVLEVAVEVLLEAGLDEGGVVGDGPRRDGDVRQHLDLEVGREGVREAHVPREGGEDEVAHLRE